MLGFLTDTDYATDQAAGIVRVNNKYGIILAQNGLLSIDPATSTDIKAGTSLNPLVPIKQHVSTFYGLAKAAGDTTQASSDNAVGTYTDAAKTAIKSMLDIPDGGDYVTKDSVDNAGITGRTYTELFNGEFSVTTATTSDYSKPYARASVTGRISKHYIYRVTVNDTVYTLRCRLWWESNNSNFKVYEYLGNIGLYVNNTSEIPGGTDNVNFVIISDLNNSNSIDVFTTTAGTYTIKVERINETLTKLPKSLIYQDSYQPFEVRNNGGTYNGFSVGVNTLANSARGTMAFGYCNNVGYDDEGFSIAFGVDNNISNDLGLAFGSHNQITGQRGIVIGNGSTASSGDAIVIGNSSTASGSGAVALGNINTVSGMSSLAGNVMNTVSGNYSAAFGAQNTVSGSYSAAFGSVNIVNHAGQFVFGACNVADPSTNPSYAAGNYIEIVGNGSSNNNRSNARTLDWDGNEHLKGDVYVNCNADSTGGTKLATVDDVPDIQIDGTSIVSSGVANIPVASVNNLGVIKVVTGYGLMVNATSKGLRIDSANSNHIKASSSGYVPITPAKQHESVFYGLTRAAGVNMNTSDNPVGTYTDAAKGAIQHMLGIDQSIAPYESDTTADNAYAIGDLFMLNGKMHRATAVTSIGDTLSVGTNCEVVGLEDVFVKNTDYPNPSSGTPGVLKLDQQNTSGLYVNSSNGKLSTAPATEAQLKEATNAYRPVTPYREHIATFYGLAKAAGDTTQSASSNAVGTYTDTAKTAIKSMLGVPNNAYDLNKGTALPANADLNDYITPGVYCTDSTTISTIENSPTTFEFKMIVEKINEDYGKQIVIDYWGYHYERAFTILDGVLLAWKKVITGEDYATSSKAGLVRVSNTFGTYVDSNYPEYIRIYRAQESDIKSGANGSNYALYRPITPQVQKNAVFYGLAEAAGDTTQSQSSNTIGTYTNEAKTAIRNMLGISSGGGGTGAVDDVQVNGTSIVSNGVANIPIANASTAGVVKADPTNGIGVESQNKMYINYAPSDLIKSGTGSYRPITPPKQHESVFYGLAKAAGDTTQSSSSNTVGTYTDEAKTAIKSMIGVPTMQEIITAVHESYASAEEVSF